VSRLTELLGRLRKENPALAADLEREVTALTDRRSFGLNFERHVPEAVELPGRKVRHGDKVRILPPRGDADAKADERLWRVISTDRKANFASLELMQQFVTEDVAVDDLACEVALDDLVVVAEFRDPIYPGLVSTGKVERGGDKPFHTVINAENYHALETLLFTHRGKVDCIYIDPPYNTGAKDWKYNNDYVEGDDLYRHSKWLAFMERRLLLAKDLLNPDDSVLIVTIDEKEYLRLGMLLEQVFPGARIQMVSSLINPAGGARAGQFGRSDEYLFFVAIGAAAPSRVRLSRDWVSTKGRTHTGNIRWDLLRRSGTSGARREDSPGCFYPIYIDPSVPKVASIGVAVPSDSSIPPPIAGLHALLPIRKDGSEGRWQWSPSTLASRMKEGRVRITGSLKSGFVVSTLKDGEFNKIKDGEFVVSGFNDDGSVIVDDISTAEVLAIPHTQWRVGSHDATQYGTRLLSSYLPNRSFPFPKSLYAVEDALRFYISKKLDAIVLDFFAGSGTTAHALMRINRQDGGRRQAIVVTNNEVSADEQRSLHIKGFRPGDREWETLGICDYITKPRIEAAISGTTPEGNSIAGDYKFTDEFPMSEGFEENVEFFTLSYECPLRVSSNREFERIAPLLWLRAGSRGRRIEDISSGWDVAETYGVLADLDSTDQFVDAVVAQGEKVVMAFIVTDEDRLFESVARALPEHVEPVRLYEAYMRNFEIESGRGLL
jgi:adenine-specific DNA-methyltransferase